MAPIVEKRSSTPLDGIAGKPVKIEWSNAVPRSQQGRTYKDLYLQDYRRPYFGADTAAVRNKVGVLDLKPVLPKREHHEVPRRGSPLDGRAPKRVGKIARQFDGQLFEGDPLDRVNIRLHLL